MNPDRTVIPADLLVSEMRAENMARVSDSNTLEEVTTTVSQQKNEVMKLGKEQWNSCRGKELKLAYLKHWAIASLHASPQQDSPFLI